MITVDQIRAMLQQLTLSKLSLDDFDEWLAQASWNAHKNSAPDTMQLVGRIERLMAEHEGGLLSEQQMMQEFRQLAGIEEPQVAEQHLAASSHSAQ